MGVTYRDLASPLVRASQHGIWNAGDRCPDVRLTLPNGGETWLYSVVTYGKYLILSLGGALSVEEKYEGIATTYTILAAPGASPTTDVAENGVGSEEFGAGSVFKADWLAAEESAVVVVRPDMYIGFVSVDTTSWKDYFQGMV